MTTITFVPYIHQSFSMYYFISLLHFLWQLDTHALYSERQEGHAAMQSSSDPPGHEPLDPFPPFLFLAYIDAFLVTFSRFSMPSTSLHCTFPASKSFSQSAHGGRTSLHRIGVRHTHGLKWLLKTYNFMKLREREGQRVDSGRSLKVIYRLQIVDYQYPFPRAYTKFGCHPPTFHLSLKSMSTCP